MKNIQHLCLIVGAALLLAACGGGSDDETPAPEASNEVPASAIASWRAYAEYTGSLVASETKDPLEVNKVAPPTTEVDDALPVT
jgi:hypothetical protein